MVTLLHFWLQKMVQHNAHIGKRFGEFNQGGNGRPAAARGQDLQVHDQAAVVGDSPGFQGLRRIEPRHAAIGLAAAEQTHTRKLVLLNVVLDQIGRVSSFGIQDHHGRKNVGIAIGRIQDVAVVIAVDHPLLHRHSPVDILRLHPGQHARNIGNFVDRVGAVVPAGLTDDARRSVRGIGCPLHGVARVSLLVIGDQMGVGIKQQGALRIGHKNGVKVLSWQRLWQR